MLITIVPYERPGAKGEAWRVIDKRPFVRFSVRGGPWLLIVPAGRAPDDVAAKWIHGILDDRFKVMPGTPD